MRNLSIFSILCIFFVSCADSTSSDYCGNNLRDGTEDCDGNDFGSVSCESLGLGGGTLYCNEDCTVNTAGCFNSTCGNGTADGPEECDEEDFGGQSCQSRGYTGGTLTCTTSCTIDESSCRQYDVCGDGFIGTTEECESDTTPLSCEDLGHYSGEVECSGCTWDVSGCERCGDDTIQTAQGEECDGEMLNSETCEGLTGIEGDLVCSNQCSFSFRNCMEIHQYGSGSDDEVARVIRASDGNLILVGTTSGNMDGQTNSGGTDIFVKKINPEGTPLWTVLLGGEGNDSGRGVAQDSSGNIIVTGYSSGSFNGYATAGHDDLLVASLDSAGAINWGLLSGTPVGDYGEAVTVDSDGNIYVAGYTYGDLDGETNAGGIDVFMVKYSSGGVRQWTALHGTPQNDYPTSVRSDSIGNTFVSGYTFGIMGQDHFGGTDAILMKINRRS
ncbi:SBBP repeat-containing protein, partial [Myxococcota bacterium]|nr:SBBP repeat-containing protein [Myxococcota bacterium]